VSWTGIWDKIKIKSVNHFKKDPHAVKSDTVEVVLHMPIEVYSTFRLQIEAPHTLGNRRSTDPKEVPPGGSPSVGRD
jgi:hypothetical protein